MKVHVLRREQFLARPRDEVFPFFAEARNLERLTPPWLRFEVVEPAPATITEGTLIDYRLHVHGVPMKWRTRIENWEPDVRFVDRQLRGPYALWHHTHDFEAIGDGTLIRDTVRYAIGFGPIGAAVHALQVQRDIDNIFAFRFAAVEQELLA